MIGAIVILGVSTIALLGTVLGPMSYLQAEQAAEHDRIGGTFAPILGWKAPQFSLYLDAGDFRKNIDNPEVVQMFVPAMWVARFQIASLCLVLGLRLF
jgi:hypothetical protein